MSMFGGGTVWTLDYNTDHSRIHRIAKVLVLREGGGGGPENIVYKVSITYWDISI